MNELDKKLKILDIQIIGTVIFIISLIINILLNYNQKEYTLHKKPIFTNKETYIISNFNRIIVLAIVIAFLYTSYQLRELSKRKGGNIKLNNLDLFASFLSVINALIVLYITVNSPIEDSLNIENPNL